MPGREGQHASCIVHQVRQESAGSAEHLPLGAQQVGALKALTIVHVTTRCTRCTFTGAHTGDN
jgi:hypothetical protein